MQPKLTPTLGIIGIAIALAATGIATSTLGPTSDVNPCDYTEDEHVYVGGTLPPFTPIVRDLCQTHFDGDQEFGIGGGFFTSCIGIPHHAQGSGAAYWAYDTVSSIAYFAGADGPHCAGDGIVSDDPLTSPLDCASGSVGEYDPGSRWTPATLEENVPGSGGCTGDVWVVVIAGAGVLGGQVYASAPTTGVIWSD